MIAIILGTRPEIIKMSPLIRVCEKENIDYFILHTGQHYSYDMDKVFFEDLQLPEPRYNLDVGSKSHAEQTGAIMTGIEKILSIEKPDVVLVQGDTNTVLAGALAASKSFAKDSSRPIDIGHVEAGLRSFDRSMPEEVNRIVTDHLSRYLFAPTEKSRQNLLAEGIAKDTIFVTGNTIVDAVEENLKLAKIKTNPLNGLNLLPKAYFLVTLHRQENVDNRERLKGILESLSQIHASFRIPLIFPVHPRTEKMIASFGFNLDGIRMVKPLGFLDFLHLESQARLILTDSGGVQEEACILKVPCVTIRDSTERPETVDVGANIIAGFRPAAIIGAVGKMMAASPTWTNPFGDCNAGEKIIRTICSYK
jgi:UDP-N-acetylglucosamine 2-epimerase